MGICRGSVVEVAGVYGATRNCLLFGCLDLRSMKLYAVNPQTLS